MPRGVKRTEVEIIQAEIAAAEKKREQGLQAAANAKKAITQLQNKIDQQLAREIAKACRTAGISLKDVLAWVQTQQAESLGAEKPVAPEAPPAKRRSPAKKATTPATRGRPKKAATTPARAKKAKVPAKPKKEVGTEKPQSSDVPSAE